MQAQSQKRCAVKRPAAQVFDQSSTIKCRLERFNNTRKKSSDVFVVRFSFDAPNQRPTEKATETILHVVKLEKHNEHSGASPERLEPTPQSKSSCSLPLGTLVLEKGMP